MEGRPPSPGKLHHEYPAHTSAVLAIRRTTVFASDRRSVRERAIYLRAICGPCRSTGRRAEEYPCQTRGPRCVSQHELPSAARSLLRCSRSRRRAASVEREAGLSGAHVHPERFRGQGAFSGERVSRHGGLVPERTFDSQVLHPPRCSAPSRLAFSAHLPGSPPPTFPLTANH